MPHTHTKFKLDWGTSLRDETIFSSMQKDEEKEEESSLTRFSAMDIVIFIKFGMWSSLFGG